MTNYWIYYMKPERLDGTTPGLKRLVDTHTFLCRYEAPSLDAVYHHFKGEVARDLIRSKGLAHTSMSVGDIIIGEDGQAWVVAGSGFTPLGEDLK
jgi:hypothetical protein